MKKNRAVFLDRDGTINVDKGYVYKIEDFKIIDGVIEGLKILNSLGFKLIIISNQSGIDRKMYSREEADKLFKYMVELLKKEGISISKFYYCPHYQEECSCRKPKLGLFYEAQKDFNISFEESYAIGDKLRDLSICNKEKVKGFLIGNEDIKSNSIKRCKSLLEAAIEIEKIEGRKNGNNYTV